MNTAQRAAGKLFVFEGPDGVGKSTLSKLFAEGLRARGVPTDHLAFPGRQEGTLGHHIYRLHHEPEAFGVVSQITAASRQLLHVAAHADAIETRILPALADGRCVVLDRFWWSTFVYGVVDGIDRETLGAIIEAEVAIWGACRPERTYLIDRERPFRQEWSDQRFAALREEYRVIAATAAEKHSVVTFENSATPEAAIEHLLSAL